MAASGVLTTAVIVGLAVATAGVFVAVIAATVMTTLAVHQEEWLRTLKRPAPSRVARCVRAILGVYVRRMDSDLDEHRPEEEPPWYERSSGPTRHLVRGRALRAGGGGLRAAPLTGARCGAEPMCRPCPLRGTPPASEHPIRNPMAISAPLPNRVSC